MMAKCLPPVIMATAALFWTVVLPAAQPPTDPTAGQEYLDAVCQFADNVLQWGKDVYGPTHTPLFVDGLEVDTHEPVTWRQDGRECVLSNLASQQNLLRCLDGLTSLTGELKYRQAGEEAVRYAMAHLRAPNGLLYWGGHLCYDAAGEQLVGYGDDREIHELKCNFPYYEFLWRVDPAATRQLIEAFWSSNILNWDNLDMNRHGSYDHEVKDVWKHAYRGGPVFFASDGAPLANTGGDLVYAAAMLSQLSTDKAPLVWAHRMAERYVQTRNEATGLSSYVYNIYPIDYAKQQFGPEFGDRVRDCTLLTPQRGQVKFALVAATDLMLGEMLGPAGQQLLQWGLEDLRAYGRHAYSPADNTFSAVCTDGTWLSPADVKRDGYYSGPGRYPYLVPAKADATFFRAYCLAYRLSKDAFFWQMARSIGRGNDLGDLGDAEGDNATLNDATACSDPAALMGFLELYKKTQREDYLRLARRIGDNILRERFVGGLFVQDRLYRYTRLDRKEPLALLHLAAVMRGQSRPVPWYWPGGWTNFWPYDGPYFHSSYQGRGKITDNEVIYSQKRP